MADAFETIDAKTLLGLLEGDGEAALIDVREEGVFGARHLLAAGNVPLSKLELMIGDLVPRLDTRLVLCDGGEGLAQTAAALLAGFGYSNLAVLDGGTEGWAAAGFELFSGLFVPSKAFGEFVEHAYGTPRVTANQLKEMMDGGEKLVVVDSRPMSEYRVMNIPTGIDMPGAELVYRIGEVAPDPDTTVVVNCAGRTRSIIGAQSLINAGIPNKVVALENGTMGWHLAGHKLEHGNERHIASVTPAMEEEAVARAEAVGARFGIKRALVAELDAWRAEAGRTTYLLDVRTAEEFAAAHPAGARHAPGGQLVQSTDAYISVRGGRVVLFDDKKVRALMTASWLVQLGWSEVYVLDHFAAGLGLETGARTATMLGGLPGDVPTIGAVAAKAATDGGAILLDLSRSLAHREAHPEGARFAIRSRLAEDIAGLAGAPMILMAPDDRQALLAAAELRAAGHDTSVLVGGLEAWKAAELPLAAGMGEPLSPTDDVYHRPYDRSNKEEIEKAMNDYLVWEIALVEQIKKPGGVRFKHWA